MEYFDAAFSTKQVDLFERVISGYAAYHNNTDRVRDIIDPAASAKAVARLGSPGEVAVFIGHNAASLPVGIPQRIEATPQGLYTETYILKGPVGDNLLAVAQDLAAHGQPLGMSIGYSTKDSRHELAGRTKVRRIMDYSLKEFSYASNAAIANPLALVHSVKQAESGGDATRDDPGRLLRPQYRVEQRGGAWVVLRDADADGDEDDDVVVGTYASPDAANDAAAALRAADLQAEREEGNEDTMQQSEDSVTKAVWSTAAVNDLPDSCFLYIEAGGQKDSEGKTTPRSLRHLPYKNADGKIDLPHLRNAIARIPQMTGISQDKKDQLQARARRLLESAGGSPGKTSTADLLACEDAAWTEGAAPHLRGMAYALLELSEATAGDYKAMAALGEDVQEYRLLRPARRAELARISASLARVAQWADLAGSQEDRAARLAYFRQQLALTEV